jgi:hypothetical protein
MAALTAEVRQRRVAVEQLARSQAETQTLGMTLSAQQGRILQLTQELDTARKEIAAAAPGQRGGFESAMRVSKQREALSSSSCSKPAVGKTTCLARSRSKRIVGTIRWPAWSKSRSKMLLSSLR